MNYTPKVFIVKIRDGGVELGYMGISGWDIFYFVGAVLAVVLTFLAFGGHIISFLKSTKRWVVRMWKSYKAGRLFAKYKPSWEIVKSGDVEINKEGVRYQIKLSIDVNFKSRDNRYETTLGLNVAKVIMWHKKDDREDDKYELRGGLPGVAIPPLKDYTAHFTFVKELRVKPLLDAGSSVQYIVYPGEAYFEYISEALSLGEGDKLTAQVVWGIEEENAK